METFERTILEALIREKGLDVVMDAINAIVEEEGIYEFKEDRTYIILRITHTSAIHHNIEVKTRTIVPWYLIDGERNYMNNGNDQDSTMINNIALSMMTGRDPDYELLVLAHAEIDEPCGKLLHRRWYKYSRIAEECRTITNHYDNSSEHEIITCTLYCLKL